MVDGLCEEYNECLMGDHDCDLNAKVDNLKSDRIILSSDLSSHKT